MGSNKTEPGNSPLGIGFKLGLACLRSVPDIFHKVQVELKLNTPVPLLTSFPRCKGSVGGLGLHFDLSLL